MLSVVDFTIVVKRGKEDYSRALEGERR